MTRFGLAVGLSLLSSTAFAQSVDCSAFRHETDGSWIVTRATRLVDTRDGVAKSVGLARNKHFSRNANPSMGGVDVYEQLQSHCR